MFAPTKQAIKKKITVFFHDPSADRPDTKIQNLGVETAAGYLAGPTTPIPVEVEPSGLAQDLLGRLCVAANRTVTYGEQGLMLSPIPPVVESAGEPAVELPDRTAQPRQLRAALAEPGRSLRRRRVYRKYKTLSSVFMKAKPKAQILSVYSTRDSNPAKPSVAARAGALRLWSGHEPPRS
jgi:hypothetical protein